MFLSAIANLQPIHYFVLVLLLLLCISFILVHYRDRIILFFKRYWRKICVVGIAVGSVTSGVVLLIPTETGDLPVVDGEAFNYWYAPENSFGISETKTVNWSYWKPWLHDMFDWNLRASPDNVTWYNARQLLDIGVDFNETSQSAKVTLTLDTTGAPRDLYYQFYILCNKTLKSYAEVNGYEWILTLPANESEDYTVFFNWSDIKNLVSSGKVWYKRGVLDDSFFFGVQTVNKIVPGVVFVVDPTFGNTAETGEYSDTSIQNILVACKGKPATSGTLDSITAKMSDTWDNGEKAKGLFYDSNLNLLATSEEKTDGTSIDAYFTFNFDAGTGVIADTVYYFGIISDSYAFIRQSTDDESDDNGGNYVESMTYGSIENPIDSWDTGQATYSNLIYCTYTENIPQFSNPNPSNESYNESIGVVTINVTVEDGNGQNMNITFYTSSDGESYTSQQTNTSVSNGSYSYKYTTTSYQTTYYWKVTANDTDGNNETSDIYNFETTPYRNTFFNDTFPNENWIDSEVNMTFETGWENFSYGLVGIVYHDTFTGSGSVDGRTPDTVGDVAWTETASATGTCSIDAVNHEAQFSTDTNDYGLIITGDSFTANEINLTITASDVDSGDDVQVLCFRYVDTDNTYFLKFSSTQSESELSVVSDGSETQLDSNFLAATDDDIITVICSDSAKTVYKNWVQVATSDNNIVDPASYYCAWGGGAFYGDGNEDLTADNAISNFIVTSNDNIVNAWILSDEIFKTQESWEYFYADVNDTNSCSFALIDPDDQDYNITSGLNGDGDDISSVTNASVMIYGNFSDSSVNMGSWNISWTTGGEPPSNTPPTQSDESPVNSSIDISTTPDLYVIVSDTDGDTINATWRYNDTITGQWYDFATNSSVVSGTNITQQNSNFTNSSATYYWSVNISDGNGSWCNETYHFTTISGITTYSDTYRIYGEDYIIYMGDNDTIGDIIASDFENITWSSDENISLWNDTGTYDTDWYADGLWYQYHPHNTSGDNFTVHTFDILRIYITDGGTSGNQTINMTENTNIEYTAERNITLDNTTQNKGSNFTGFTLTISAPNNNLSSITDDKTNLTAGEQLCVWNRTYFGWDCWIKDFEIWMLDETIVQYDVFQTKVENTRYFEVSAL